jgi:hypothetical protein
MNTHVGSRPALPPLTWRTQPWFERAVPYAVFMAVGLAAISLYLYRLLSIAGTLHTPLDDAWIHFRFAYNLARGDGMSYNPGIQTPGSTSPLWVVVLAGAYRLTGEFLITSKVLGVIAYLAAIAGVYALSYLIRPQRGLALLAALFAALSGRFVWAALSGMETALFAALMVWTIYLHLLYRHDTGWRQYLPTVLVGLAMVTRPEAAALFLLTMVDRCAAITAPEGGSTFPSVTFRRPTAGLLVHGLIFVALIAPNLLFNYLTAGSLLPNTFAGQSLPQGGSPPTRASWLPDLDYMREAVRSFIRDNFMLALFVPYGVTLVVQSFAGRRDGRRGSFIVLAWTLGLPVLAAFVAPNLRHHERYLMPLLPLVALVGAHGLARAERLVPGGRLAFGLPGRTLKVAILPVLVVLTLVVGIRETNGWAVQFARDVRNIDEVNVALGYWLRENTPPDAVIAMHDIGATVFLSDRHVIDTVGLVEPAILPYIRRAGDAGVEEYLRALRPDYFVSWRSWYPNITDNRRDCQEVYAAAARQRNLRTLLPDSEMVVYRCTWQGQ